MKVFAILALSLLLAGCITPPELRCIASPLQGIVTLHGRPVSGAKVSRVYFSHWYNDHVEKTVYTNVDGTFAFPSAWKATAASLLHQAVIEISVVVEYENRTYTALTITKMNYDRYGELVSSRSDHAKSRLLRKENSLYLSCELDEIPATTKTEPPNQTLQRNGHVYTKPRYARLAPIRFACGSS
jgi:hypothetical protein